MLLLIDGYNLLKTIEPGASKSNRDAFIALLNAYAKRKRHHLMVVFDGGPTFEPFKERQGELTVFYSGNQTADEIIQELLDVYEDEKNILLISSDMQLKHYAKLRAIIAIDSNVFAQLLPERKKTPRQTHVTRLDGKAHKLESEMMPELDQLMAREVRFAKQEDEMQQESKHERLQALAGNDKKLMSILKKL